MSVVAYRIIGIILRVVISFRPLLTHARHTLATRRNGKQRVPYLGGTSPGTDDRHEEIDYFVGLPFWNMTPQNAARRDGLPLKGNHTQNRGVGELVMLPLRYRESKIRGLNRTPRLPSLPSARSK